MDALERPAPWTCDVCTLSQPAVSRLGSCGVCDLEVCRDCQRKAASAANASEQTPQQFRWTYQPGQPDEFRSLAGAWLTAALKEPLPGFSLFWCLDCCLNDLETGGSAQSSCHVRPRATFF